jgi:hypothetical protein
MKVKSKTLAAWLATLGGALGLHRFYLFGWRDPLAWLHVPVTLSGYTGVLRMQELGQDDQRAWILIPLLGLMLAQGMLHGIVYGLMPDARWDNRHNGGQTVSRSGWGAVLAVITALMVGSAVLMGSIAFGVQKYFEWSLAG